MPALPNLNELAGLSSSSSSHNSDLLHVSLTFRNHTSRFSLDIASRYGLAPPTTHDSTPFWNASSPVTEQMTLAQKAEARAAGYYVGKLDIPYWMCVGIVESVSNGV